MKKYIILKFLTITCVMCSLSFSVLSQNVGINSTGASPDPSAGLDVNFSNKGFLLPRVSDTMAVNSPAQGLQIYDLSSKCLRVRTNVKWSNCLGTLDDPIPSPPSSISGSVNVCSGSTGNTYSIAAVSGATSYVWSVPAGSSITGGQGTTNVTITFGSTSGNISVVATNASGTSSSSQIAVNVSSAVASVPGTITGPSNVCAGSINNYSISAVAGATSFVWTVPVGSSILAGQNSTQITVLVGSSGGNVTVVAVNGCGNSTASTKTLTVANSVPSTPGLITGQSSRCSTNMVQQPYSITAVAGATSYFWTVPSGAPLVGQGNSSVTIGPGSVSGNVTVAAVNACGMSTASILPVTISTAIPAAPAAIFGTTNPCASSSNVAYSIAPISGATTYTWSVPSGATMTGQGNSSIIVTFGSTNGNITVSSANACGSSASTTIPITLLSSVGPFTASVHDETNYTSFKAKWTASANATAYCLDVSTNSGFSSFVAGYNNLNVGSTLNYTVTGLTANTDYYYRVRAINGCSVSANTATIAANTIKNPTVTSCNPSQSESAYGMLITNLNGVNSLSWLPRNLGATATATSINDPSIAAAGCYYQFNRPQGYGVDGVSVGTVANPAWGTTAVYVSSDWESKNDPCRQSLGGRWRVPTMAELKSVTNTFTTWNSAFTSPLKLHCAGKVTNGTLDLRGTDIYLWTSTENSSTEGNGFAANSNNLFLYFNFGKYGTYPVRCVK